MIKFRYERWEVALHLCYMVFLVVYCTYQYWFIGKRQAVELSESWIGLRDSHDIQWEAFRNSIPLIFALAAGWKLVGDRQHSWIFGLVLCIFTFRADCLILFPILLGYYQFVKRYYTLKRFELYAWTASVGILVLHEISGRYRFLSDWMEPYVKIDWFKNSKHVIHWGSLFNMTMLKLIAFAVDMHRSHAKSQHVEKHYEKCKKCAGTDRPCLKARDLIPAPQPITLRAFLNYVLFSGTFLAGPPTGYNNFCSFDRHPMNCRSPIPRFLLVLASFELYQRIYPICKPLPSNTLIQLEIISLLRLMFLWYKFLVIWRWARVWCYLSGVEVVDNMNRCMFNNYGFEGFWRMWHRGYNLWLVRYLFVPAGGNRSFWSYLAVFAFVAFWHDPELKMVLWVLCIVPFMVPELLVKKYFRKHHKELFKQHWFKYLSAFGGGCYIYLLCIANLVGFGYGYEGLLVVLRKMLEEPVALVGSLATLTSAVILMFYVRDNEEEDFGY